MTPAIEAAKRARIPYTVHRYVHDPAGPGYGEEAAAALEVTPDRVFKTLVVDAAGELAVAIVPVSAKLDLKACAGILGAKRTDIADPRAAQRATGYVVGGISPLGQKRRLRTLLDDSAMRFDTVYVSAGRRGLEIELAPGDLGRLTNARVAPVTAG